MIAFEKGFFFDRRAGRVHIFIIHSCIRRFVQKSFFTKENCCKFQTFLKVFEKNDEKVILMSTNIIIGQLNIKDYEYDDGVTIF